LVGWTELRFSRQAGQEHLANKSRHGISSSLD
jgi:hypothetical protein